LDTRASSLDDSSPEKFPSIRGASDLSHTCGRSITLTKSSGVESEDGILIHDLCNFIKSLSEGIPSSVSAPALGVLGRKNEKYTVKVTSLDAWTEPPSLVSLDDYLSPPHRYQVTRKKRMDLALSLSLAILQFYQTPWIDMWWTCRDFSILHGEKPQVFITKRFYSVNNSLNLKIQPESLSASAFWDCIGEPVLTRLGFALIELALGQRLSELRPQEVESVPGVPEDMVDLMTAKDLVGEGRVLEEAGKCYHDAVQACLTHQVIVDGGVKGLSSRHPNFQSDVERFVVTPIRDTFQASWGLIPKLEM
jgi:hypothetical protein